MSSLSRKCEPCKADRLRILGDGSYGSLERGSFDQYWTAIEMRRKLSGRHYDLEPGVITRGTFDLFIDKYMGRVCEDCRTPFAEAA